MEGFIIPNLRVMGIAGVMLKLPNVDMFCSVISSFAGILSIFSERSTKMEHYMPPQPRSWSRPCSLVGRGKDVRTGVRCFGPQLRRYFFLGLMIAIASGFIPFSMLTIVSTINVQKSSYWLGKYIVLTLMKGERQKSMDRYIGRCKITWIKLKAYIINRTIKHFMLSIYVDVEYWKCP